MAYPNDQGNPAGAIPVYIAGGPANSSKNLATNASTAIKAGAGTLTSVVVNNDGITTTLKLYDGTSAAGILLATISTTAQVSLSYGIAFTTGLFAVTAGAVAADVTICFV